MTRNSNFQDVNMALHRRWLHLQSLEDQTSREASILRRDLGNDVIAANRRMIGSEINKYATRSPELEHDLFDTAAAELWKAFQKWDPERGTLRTVAMPYIKGAVRREMVRHDHPHLTYDDFTLRNKVVTAKREFEVAHGKVPTFRELAAVTQIPEVKISVLFADNPVSLDKPMGGSDGEDTTLEAVIAEREQANAAGTAEELAEMNSQLEPEAVESSDPLELVVYLMREGSASGRSARTAEVGYMLGIPTERAINRASMHFALQNAYCKLRRMLGRTPTEEQMHVLSGANLAAVGQFMREQDVLEAHQLLQDLHHEEPSVELIAEATGHEVSDVARILNAR